MTNEPLATVRLTRRFTAAPERVFDAWLDPTLVRRWMVAPTHRLGGAVDEIARIQLDSRVGGKFSFVVLRDGEEVDHAGEYLELLRPRHLVFTWNVPRYSAVTSMVKLDLAPSGSGTLLTLTHERVLESYRTRTEAGWGAIVDAIEVALTE
jgi:uncharacterized protein YndB with AHSA1/START domain